MTHQQVQWEEPPPGRSQRYDWEDIAEQLRKKPGVWGKVFDRDRTSLAASIRIDGIRALSPTKGFEVRTRNNIRSDPDFDGARSCTLYLRYNPKKDRSSK